LTFKMGCAAKPVVGGQAVIEGVMMKSKDQMAIAVRKPNNKIIVKKEKLKSIVYKNKFFNLPLIRGIVVLFETLIIGIKALTFSANIAVEDDTSKKGEKEKLSGWSIAFTILISIALAVGVFILLPLFLTGLLTKSHGFYFNLIDGVIRIGIFILYIGAISFMKDVKRLFQYHGAEHKSVFCFEAGKKLTVENARGFSPLHPRCGTTLIVLVLVISILLFSIVTSPLWIIKFIVRLAFIPVIAAFSYEFLKFGANYHNNWFVRILIAPGLLIQMITTREPDDSQIEVALEALKAVVPKKDI
jgi:uncharacterized protein YqhQ